MSDQNTKEPKELSLGDNFGKAVIHVNGMTIRTYGNQYLSVEKEDGTKAIITGDDVEAHGRNITVRAIGEVQSKPPFTDDYKARGQDIFEHYIALASRWLQEESEDLDQELQTFEKPVGVGSFKDFRHMVVGYVERFNDRNEGNPLSWTSYKQIESLVEEALASQRVTKQRPTFSPLSFLNT